MRYSGINKRCHYSIWNIRCKNLNLWHFTSERWYMPALYAKLLLDLYKVCTNKSSDHAEIFNITLKCHLISKSFCWPFSFIILHNTDLTAFYLFLFLYIEHTQTLRRSLMHNVNTLLLSFLLLHVLHHLEKTAFYFLTNSAAINTHFLEQ